MSTEKRKWHSAILLPVFLPAVIVIALLVVGTLSAPEKAGELFSWTLAGITENFGWFYMLAVALFLMFIIGVGVSSWGKIKLGPDHCEPEYSFTSWFAMLFSAGYGIALLFLVSLSPYYIMPSPRLVRLKPSAQLNRRCKSLIFTGAFTFGQFTAWSVWFWPIFHFATAYRSPCAQPCTHSSVIKLMAPLGILLIPSPFSAPCSALPPR